VNVVPVEVTVWLEPAEHPEPSAVQISPVYVPLNPEPVEFVKVTVTAFAVVDDGATVTLVGAITWLVAAWGPTCVEEET
jgi:hypothetical protein